MFNFWKKFKYWLVRRKTNKLLKQIENDLKRRNENPSDALQIFVDDVLLNYAKQVETQRIETKQILDDRERQRRSWVFGNTAIGNSDITEKLVNDIGDELLRSKCEHIQK